MHQFTAFKNAKNGVTGGRTPSKAFQFVTFTYDNKDAEYVCFGYKELRNKVL